MPDDSRIQDLFEEVVKAAKEALRELTCELQQHPPRDLPLRLRGVVRPGHPVVVVDSVARARVVIAPACRLEVAPLRVPTV